MDCDEGSQEQALSKEKILESNESSSDSSDLEDESDDSSTDSSVIEEESGDSSVDSLSLDEAPVREEQDSDSPLEDYQINPVRAVYSHVGIPRKILKEILQAPVPENDEKMGTSGTSTVLVPKGNEEDNDVTILDYKKGEVGLSSNSNVVTNLLKAQKQVCEESVANQQTVLYTHSYVETSDESDDSVTLLESTEDTFQVSALKSEKMETSSSTSGQKSKCNDKAMTVPALGFERGDLGMSSTVVDTLVKAEEEGAVNMNNYLEQSEESLYSESSLDSTEENMEESEVENEEKMDTNNTSVAQESQCNKEHKIVTVANYGQDIGANRSSNVINILLKTQEQVTEESFAEQQEVLYSPNYVEIIDESEDSESSSDSTEEALQEAELESEEEEMGTCVTSIVQESKDKDEEKAVTIMNYGQEVGTSNSSTVMSSFLKAEKQGAKKLGTEEKQVVPDKESYFETDEESVISESLLDNTVGVLESVEETGTSSATTGLGLKSNTNDESVTAMHIVKGEARTSRLLKPEEQDDDESVVDSKQDVLHTEKCTVIDGKSAHTKPLLDNTKEIVEALVTKSKEKMDTSSTNTGLESKCVEATTPIDVEKTKVETSDTGVISLSKTGEQTVEESTEEGKHDVLYAKNYLEVTREKVDLDSSGISENNLKIPLLMDGEKMDISCTSSVQESKGNEKEESVMEINCNKEKIGTVSTVVSSLLKVDEQIVGESHTKYKQVLNMENYVESDEESMHSESLLKNVEESLKEPMIEGEEKLDTNVINTTDDSKYNERDKISSPIANEKREVGTNDNSTVVASLLNTEEQVIEESVTEVQQGVLYTDEESFETNEESVYSESSIHSTEESLQESIIQSKLTVDSSGSSTDWESKGNETEAINCEKIEVGTSSTVVPSLLTTDQIIKESFTESKHDVLYSENYLEGKEESMDSDSSDSSDDKIKIPFLESEEKTDTSCTNLVRESKGNEKDECVARIDYNKEMVEMDKTVVGSVSNAEDQVVEDLVAENKQEVPYTENCVETDEESVDSDASLDSTEENLKEQVTESEEEMDTSCTNTSQDCKYDEIETAIHCEQESETNSDHTAAKSVLQPEEQIEELDLECKQDVLCTQNYLKTNKESMNSDSSVESTKEILEAPLLDSKEKMNFHSTNTVQENAAVVDHKRNEVGEGSNVATSLLKKEEHNTEKSIVEDRQDLYSEHILRQNEELLYSESSVVSDEVLEEPVGETNENMDTSNINTVQDSKNNEKDIIATSIGYEKREVETNDHSSGVTSLLSTDKQDFKKSVAEAQQAEQFTDEDSVETDEDSVYSESSIDSIEETLEAPVIDSKEKMDTSSMHTGWQSKCNETKTVDYEKVEVGTVDYEKVEVGTSSTTVPSLLKTEQVIEESVEEGKHDVPYPENSLKQEEELVDSDSSDSSESIFKIPLFKAEEKTFAICTDTVQESKDAVVSSLLKADEQNVESVAECKQDVLNTDKNVEINKKSADIESSLNSSTEEIFQAPRLEKMDTSDSSAVQVLKCNEDESEIEKGKEKANSKSAAVASLITDEQVAKESFAESKREVLYTENCGETDKESVDSESLLDRTEEILEAPVHLGEEKMDISSSSTVQKSKHHEPATAMDHEKIEAGTSSTDVSGLLKTEQVIVESVKEDKQDDLYSESSIVSTEEILEEPVVECNERMDTSSTTTVQDSKYNETDKITTIIDNAEREVGANDSGTVVTSLFNTEDQVLEESVAEAQEDVPYTDDESVETDEESAYSESSIDSLEIHEDLVIEKKEKMDTSSTKDVQNYKYDDIETGDYEQEMEANSKSTAVNCLLKGDERVEESGTLGKEVVMDTENSLETDKELVDSESSLDSTEFLEESVVKKQEKTDTSNTIIDQHHKSNEQDEAEGTINSEITGAGANSNSTINSKLKVEEQVVEQSVAEAKQGVLCRPNYLETGEDSLSSKPLKDTDLLEAVHVSEKKFNTHTVEDKTASVDYEKEVGTSITNVDSLEAEVQIVVQPVAKDMQLVLDKKNSLEQNEESTISDSSVDIVKEILEEPEVESREKMDTSSTNTGQESTCNEKDEITTVMEYEQGEVETCSTVVNSLLQAEEQAAGESTAESKQVVQDMQNCLEPQEELAGSKFSADHTKEILQSLVGSEETMDTSRTNMLQEAKCKDDVEAAVVKKCEKGEAGTNSNSIAINSLSKFEEQVVDDRVVAEDQQNMQNTEKCLKESNEVLVSEFSLNSTRESLQAPVLESEEKMDTSSTSAVQNYVVNEKEVIEMKMDYNKGKMESTSTVLKSLLNPEDEYIEESIVEDKQGVLYIKNYSEIYEDSVISQSSLDSRDESLQAPLLKNEEKMQTITVQEFECNTENKTVTGMDSGQEEVGNSSTVLSSSSKAEQVEEPITCGKKDLLYMENYLETDEESVASESVADNTEESLHEPVLKCEEKPDTSSPNIVQEHKCNEEEKTITVIGYKEVSTNGNDSSVCQSLKEEQEVSVAEDKKDLLHMSNYLEIRDESMSSESSVDNPEETPQKQVLENKEKVGTNTVQEPKSNEKNETVTAVDCDKEMVANDDSTVVKNLLKAEEKPEESVAKSKQDLLYMSNYLETDEESVASESLVDSTEETLQAPVLECEEKMDTSCASTTQESIGDEAKESMTIIDYEKNKVTTDSNNTSVKSVLKADEQVCEESVEKTKQDVLRMESSLYISEGTLVSEFSSESGTHLPTLSVRCGHENSPEAEESVVESKVSAHESKSTDSPASFLKTVREPSVESSEKSGKEFNTTSRSGNEEDSIETPDNEKDLVLNGKDCEKAFSSDNKHLVVEGRGVKRVYTPDNEDQPVLDRDYEGVVIFDNGKKLLLDETENEQASILDDGKQQILDGRDEEAASTPELAFENMPTTDTKQDTKNISTNNSYTIFSESARESIKMPKPQLDEAPLLESKHEQRTADLRAAEEVSPCTYEEKDSQIDNLENSECQKIKKKYKKRNPSINRATQTAIQLLDSSEFSNYSPDLVTMQVEVGFMSVDALQDLDPSLDDWPVLLVSQLRLRDSIINTLNAKLLDLLSKGRRIEQDADYLRLKIVDLKQQVRKSRQNKRDQNCQTTDEDFANAWNKWYCGSWHQYYGESDPSSTHYWPGHYAQLTTVSSIPQVNPTGNEEDSISGKNCTSTLKSNEQSSLSHQEDKRADHDAQTSLDSQGSQHDTTRSDIQAQSLGETAEANEECDQKWTKETRSKEDELSKSQEESQWHVQQPVKKVNDIECATTSSALSFSDKVTENSEKMVSTTCKNYEQNMLSNGKKSKLDHHPPEMTEESENKKIKTSSEGYGWDPSGKLSVTDQVKAVATEAVYGSGYVFQEDLGLYFDYTSGYYYNAENGLYYDGKTGTYFYYDHTKQAYEFYSQVATKNQGKRKLKKDEGDEETQQEKKKKLTNLKAINVAEKEEGECSDTDEEDNKDEVAVGSEEEIEVIKEIGEDTGMSEDSNENEEEEVHIPPSLRLMVTESDSGRIKVGTLHLITLNGGTVGRESRNLVQLPDLTISKVHAEISYKSDGPDDHHYFIKDLGSNNGTFVNGVRLSEARETSQEVEIGHGWQLQFGAVKLKCHVHPKRLTCNECEPGLVLSNISSQMKSVVGGSVTSFKDAKSREKARKKQLKALRKKYAVTAQGELPSTDGQYTDRSLKRLKEVGSDNPYEKTEVASTDTALRDNNKGYTILQKMGWSEGQALGKSKGGITEPIQAESVVGSAGLGCTHVAPPLDPAEEKRRKYLQITQNRYKQT
ncbi:hypothetical protein OTU49_011836 [Cherax quadricarinatus]|uniref:Uncharacterized protein n=1 Tax=Cherax quadricarinatus TaxID=27406 RepID=A0AAW0W1K8_CHEQU